MLSEEDLDALRWARGKGIFPVSLAPHDCLIDEQGNEVSLAEADAATALWLPSLMGLRAAVGRVFRSDVKVVYFGTLTMISVYYLTKKVEAAATDHRGLVLMFLKRLKDVDQQRDCGSD